MLPSATREVMSPSSEQNHVALACWQWKMTWVTSSSATPQRLHIGLMEAILFVSAAAVGRAPWTALKKKWILRRIPGVFQFFLQRLLSLLVTCLLSSGWELISKWYSAFTEKSPFLVHVNISLSFEPFLKMVSLSSLNIMAAFFAPKEADSAVIFQDRLLKLKREATLIRSYAFTGEATSCHPENQGCECVAQVCPSLRDYPTNCCMRLLWCIIAHHILVHTEVRWVFQHDEVRWYFAFRIRTHKAELPETTFQMALSMIALFNSTRFLNPRPPSNFGAVRMPHFTKHIVFLSFFPQKNCTHFDLILSKTNCVFE